MSKKKLTKKILLERVMEKVNSLGFNDELIIYYFDLPGIRYFEDAEGAHLYLSPNIATSLRYPRNEYNNQNPHVIITKLRTVLQSLNPSYISNVMILKQPELF